MDIEEFTEDVKQFVSKTGLLTITLFIGGMFLFHLLAAYYPGLHFIGVSVLLFSCGLGAFYVIDRWVFPNINFMQEIKAGNMAVALCFCAVLAFISATELCAFSVFFTLR